MTDIAAVVLAAGKGKRMKSDLAKVLHTLFGRPMIEYLIDTLISLNIKKIVIVIGHQAELVTATLGKYQGKIEFALQAEQLGTGHAVLVTEEALSGFSGDILVTAGDVPFLTRETIDKLLAVHRREKASATVLSSIPPDPAGYGRVIRFPGTDLVDRIVEHKDADEDQRKIGEINSGTFCFDSQCLFAALRRIRADNSQNEYYLTDVMEILRGQGHKAAVCLADDPDEVLGVNSSEQLTELEARFGQKAGFRAPIGRQERIKK